MIVKHRGCDAQNNLATLLQMLLVVFSSVIVVSGTFMLWNMMLVMYNVTLQIKIEDGPPCLWEVGMGEHI